MIKQIKVGYDNFSYIIYCPKSKKTAIVDPGYETNKLLDFISSKNLILNYSINTHYHSDHSQDNKKLKDLYPHVNIIASKADGIKLNVPVDRIISEGDQIKLGTVDLMFLLTPGHTPGGLCIIVDNQALITGDTLFIGDCGRTDLPGGSIEQMYRTLSKKIITLPDHLIVYPGHDYGDKPYDTLGHQKQTNKTLLAKNVTELSEIP